MDDKQAKETRELYHQFVTGQISLEQWESHCKQLMEDVIIPDAKDVFMRLKEGRTGEAEAES